ncbi:hypothetical protein [Haliangium sp. UPWRP_2]|uniref:hypothetical protein n=1 Tax=Haliangium sp. UPWRP_2 TaxID=1931276 RepID=UPI001E2A3680|nr:hypothetical protein [Haliangium sp. UPWRP_2]
MTGSTIQCIARSMRLTTLVFAVTLHAQMTKSFILLLLLLPACENKVLPPKDLAAPPPPIVDFAAPASVDMAQGPQFEPKFQQLIDAIGKDLKASDQLILVNNIKENLLNNIPAWEALRHKPIVDKSGQLIDPLETLKDLKIAIKRRNGIDDPTFRYIMIKEKGLVFGSAIARSNGGFTISPILAKSPVLGYGLDSRILKVIDHLNPEMTTEARTELALKVGIALSNKVANIEYIVRYQITDPYGRAFDPRKILSDICKAFRKQSTRADVIRRTAMYNLGPEFGLTVINLNALPTPCVIPAEKSVE